MLNPKQLETIFKGCANHRRIRILELINEQASLSEIEIATHLKYCQKNTSEHLRRLRHAGLVTKHRQQNLVLHQLSALGTKMFSFAQDLKKPSD